MNPSISNSDYGHDDFDKLKPILGKTASRTKELKDLRNKLSEYKQWYREEHAEREKLIGALEWIAHVNAMDYEYQKVARAVLAEVKEIK